MPRKLTVFIILLIVNILVAYGSYINMLNKSASGVKLTAATAPDFTWQDFNGKSGSLKDLSGKPVIIHFWASWCRPCRTEFPELLKAAKQMNNVVFLTISADNSIETAEKFIKEAKKNAAVTDLPNLIYAFDPDKKIAFDIFHTSMYPETIIIDSEHRMRRKFSGMVRWDGDDLSQYVTCMLSDADCTRN